MVEDIPLPSDSPYKYFNYKSVRYSFPVCFDYTPPKKNNNPKIVRCKTCRKVFSKASTLRIHRKTHAAFATGPYTPKDFAKRFSTASVSKEPYRPAAHLKLLEAVSPHPREYDGYLESPGPLPYIKPGANLTMHHDKFTVGDMIGEGGFAKVFAATWENGPSEERSTVLKVQMPANDWEWYILNQVKTRFEELEHPLKEKDGGETWKCGFMSSPRCYTYSNGAVIISQFQRMGTLLDLVNLTKNADKSIIEPIAIFLTAELLGLMELLHSVNIVHADLKPDNFLVRHIPTTTQAPSLQLIDFGKAIDLRLEGGSTSDPKSSPNSGTNGIGNGVDARKKLDYSNTTEDKSVAGMEGDVEMPKDGPMPKVPSDQKNIDTKNPLEAVENGVKVDHEPSTNEIKPVEVEGTLPPVSEVPSNKVASDAAAPKDASVQDKNDKDSEEGRTGKYHMDYFGIAGRLLTS